MKAQSRTVLIFPTRNLVIKVSLILLLICLSASGVGYAQNEAGQALTAANGHSTADVPPPDEVVPEDNSFTRTYYTQKDTYVNSGSLGSNYGDSTDLMVHRYLQTPITHNKYTLIGFDISDLPTNAVIDNAVLQIYSEINTGAAVGSPEAITIVPDALNSSWEEMDVDWLSRPTMTNLGDTGLAYSSGWHNINVYNIVNAWQTGATPNYGIGLRLGSSQLGLAIFHSRETGVSTTPRLVVTYHTEGSPAKLPVQEDTYIDANLPGSNFGSLTYYRVGVNRYGLLKFDLSDLPANIQVTSAKLWLYSEINNAPEPPEAPNDIYPYLVLSTWNESTVTWNSNVQAVYRDDGPLVYQIGWIEANVTNIVSDWVDGTYINNGIELRLGDGGTTSRDFFAIPAQNRAYLTIEYTDAPPPCTPISSVSLSGPTSGLTDTSYTFTAGITPPDATTPITYTFSATDFGPSTGSNNSISFSWSTPGTKTVSVEAENCGGTQSNSLQIVIEEPPPDCDFPLVGLDISGPLEGLVNNSYNFESVIDPANATLPVDYAWQASDQTGIITTPDVSYNWSVSGTQAITLTATNCGGSFVAYHSFQAFETSQLADLIVSSVWFEPDTSRIGYLVQNTGGRSAPADFMVEAYKNDSLFASELFPTTIPAHAVRVGYIPSSWSCSGSSGVIEIRADTLNMVFEGNDANNTLTDTWACDLTPPNITSGPTVTDITEHTAVISWNTDDPTTTHLEYGWSTYSPEVVEQLVPATSHAVELTGLIPGMSYFFDIEATNTNGQLLVVPRKYFSTLPPGSDPPVITGMVFGKYPLDDYEFYTISADLADPSHTQRVEFYWEGDLIGTDYSWLGGFQIYISPHHMGWTRNEFFRNVHEITVIAFNLEGESDQWIESVYPLDNPTPVTLQILSPGDDYPVYYSGSSVPASIWYTSTIQAFSSEWKCTMTGSSEGNPSGLGGIPCEGLMTKLTKVTLTVTHNGTEIKSTEVTPAGTVFDASINLEGLTAGTYEFGIETTLPSAASISQDFNVIKGDVPLEVERSVTRSQNYFTVQILIKNISGSTVHLDKVSDSMIGFQLVGYGNENPGYTIHPNGYFSNDWFVNTPVFDIDGTLTPGSTYTFSYQVVPVMFEDYRQPKIGQLPMKITLTDGRKTDVVATASLVDDPLAGYLIPLEASYLNALDSADYVLVTNPWQASSHYGASYGEDLHKVYGAMARLARLKLGVLAFTRTYDIETLDNLLEPGSWWTDSLNPAFQESNSGFVLLVGEIEVIPAYYEGTGHFVTFAGIPDWVPYSDLRYADISGNTARPELVLGRIPGNNPTKWLNSLQLVIDVYTGERHWDGEIALAASGRGEGVTSVMIPTIKIVDHVMDDANIYSSQLHLYDYPHDQRIIQMQANIIGKDTIIIMGHGNPTSWNDATFTPWNILDYQWNDIVPAIFAMSCKTGNYEDKDDDSVAEGFVNNAAGVYIGSTQSTEMWSGEWGVKKFTRQWANYPGRSFGQALNRMKNFAFAYDTGAFDHGKQLAFSYNLYGDPKFAISPDLAVLTPEPEVYLYDRYELDQNLGTQELLVSLPDFTVDPREDGDFVEIPGGDWLFRDGSYIVPMVVVQQEFPEGVWVQEVNLTAQDALTTTHGLQLPRLMSLPFCEGCSGDPLPPAPEGWVPDLAENYTWELQVNQDGTSTLYVTIYPFHYNGEILDALYYQEWTFEVQTIETSVSIAAMDVDESSSPLNSPIQISAWLANPGEPLDLYATIEIRRQVSQDLVGSLPIQHLESVAGSAGLTAVWDSTGSPEGGYYAEISIMDENGYILVSGSKEFDLGVPAMEVTDFAVTPDIFEPGTVESLHINVRNTGDVTLDGVAVIQIFANGELSPTLTITHSISALDPGLSVAFDDVWDTTGLTGTEYVLKAYIKYNSQTSEPWVIFLDDRYELYLPVARR